MSEQSLQFDPDLVRRYDVTGPRYTSYPTAPQFTERCGEPWYRRQVALSNEDLVPRSLSLYVHIPFCRTVCFYCGCNKIITANYQRADDYLGRLRREIEMQGALLEIGRASCRERVLRLV